MVSVDVKHHVYLLLSVRSYRSEVRARLQLFFDSGTRAEVLEIRDQSAANARRRLLDLQ